MKNRGLSAANSDLCNWLNFIPPSPVFAHGQDSRVFDAIFFASLGVLFFHRIPSLSCFKHTVPTGLLIIPFPWSCHSASNPRRVTDSLCPPCSRGTGCGQEFDLAEADPNSNITCLDDSYDLELPLQAHWNPNTVSMQSLCAKPQYGGGLPGENIAGWCEDPYSATRCRTRIICIWFYTQGHSRNVSRTRLAPDLGLMSVGVPLAHFFLFSLR